MTPAEAHALARTLATSWPGRGVPVDTWAPALEPLDYRPALDAIVHLVDTREEPPSVASFKAAYRACATPLRTYLREDCARCGGTGYETIEVQRPGYPVPTSGVVPCRCSNGRAVSDAHRRAVEHNEHELRRTRPLNATEPAA